MKALNVFPLARLALGLCLTAALISCSEHTSSNRSDTFQSTKSVETASQSHGVIQWVDPFIGSAGDSGQLHPGSTVPFGMVQMGPETPGRPHAGYDFLSETIEGFAHTRTAGVGCRGAGGNILTRADYGLPSLDDEGALVPVVIDKASEVASAGYYSTSYGESGVKVELTASPSAGWQRYSFPESGKITVTVDTLHAHHENYGGSYSVQENGRLTGMVSGPTVCKEGRYQFFFSMLPSMAPESVTQLDSSRVQYHYTVNAGEQLVLHTGISAVDAITAEQARSKEVSSAGFDGAMQLAEKAWEDVLSKVVVEGTESQKRLFYTHLYHVYQSPSNLTTSVSQYRASDGQVYQKGEHDYFFGWSIWDNFRTQLPLLTLLEPKTMESITASLAQLYFQNKQHWATEQAPLPTVRTEHSSIVLLDAWQKGIRSFDLHALMPKLTDEADGMPRTSPDQILEASYDDWAVAKFAKIAQQDAQAAHYTTSAASYRSMWKEKFKHVNDTFDIMHGDGLYEGTLWQYRWFVPFDMQWVVNELGGEAKFNQQLSEFFDKELFNMGNQPDIQTPFIFSLTGQPWKTQQVVHNLMNTKMNHWYGTHEKKDTPYFGYAFTDTPYGMIPEMDNDAGTMSGWYLFAVMGLYPALPGEPVYSLHTPQLSSITLRLENAKTLRIETDKDPIANPYIESVTFNGEAWNKAFITHTALISGGVLSFTLSDTPNKAWASESGYLSSLSH